MSKPTTTLAIVIATIVTFSLGISFYLLQQQQKQKKTTRTTNLLTRIDEHGENDIPEAFTLAVERVKHLNVQDTSVLLKLYGLYKRVLFGLAKENDKPWEPTARAKWNAWNDCRDLSREEAIALYVDLVKSISMSSNATAENSNKKPSIGPKVSKMAATVDKGQLYEFEGSKLFDEAREDFSKLSELIATYPDLIKCHDEENRTLLHWAVDSDCLEAVYLLIEHGAEVDAVDLEGLTPLGYAASSDLAEIATFLLSVGADPDKASCEQAAHELTRNTELKATLKAAADRGKQ
jgi:acyl-CoA-binding protein